MEKTPSSLEDIEITSPCLASWDQMKGDERSRFCDICQLNVYDISKMSRAEALAFIQQKESRICIRLWRRSDGRVITSDCAAASRVVVAKRRIPFPIAAAALIAIGMASSGCRRPSVTPHVHSDLCASEPLTKRGSTNCNKEVVVVVGGVGPFTTNPELGTYSYQMEYLKGIPLP